jgi:hypothetical protein
MFALVCRALVEKLSFSQWQREGYMSFCHADIMIWKALIYVDYM